jgi:hypothetical protein
MIEFLKVRNDGQLDSAKLVGPQHPDALDLKGRVRAIRTQFTWYERRAERDERHQQGANANLGRPGSSQEWQHTFAKAPAHG